LDGRAPNQDFAPSERQAMHWDVIVIQEGEAESFKRKGLWDMSFDVPTYNEHAFLPSDDKDRLMALDEGHLFCNTMKQIGQAFAIGCF